MKIGVYGGTFDPIHWGHLVLAEEARTQTRLDKVLFVPSGQPPHKLDRALTPFSHRLKMVRLALEGSDGFEVSSVEADESRPHYTLETLDSLSRLHPNDEISFILGSDSLLEMKNWRQPEDIAARYPLVVLLRPGHDPLEASPVFTRRMKVVDGLSVAISSTLVRDRLARGASVRFLVPAPVADYARRHGLYGASA
jgi:nicotinate-nucleotide adenylyltransferase